MPGYSDTEEDEVLSDPEEHSSSGSESDGSDASSGSDSDDDGEDEETAGRGASNSFTSPSTLNDTSTRTSGSLQQPMAAAAEHSGGRAEDGEADAEDNDRENAMSQESANHPQRLFHSQHSGDASRKDDDDEDDDDNDIDNEATEAPSQQQQQSQSLLGSDSDTDDGADAATTNNNGKGRASDVILTADASITERGPTGTIVRRSKHENEPVLTAPDKDSDVELGPTGTIPRGASKKPAAAAPAAATAVPPAAAASMTRYIAEEQYEKGSEGDDESGDDDDQDMGQEEESEDEEEESSSDEDEGDDGDGTLCSHERERSRILRVAHSELTNLGAALRCPICLHTFRRPAVLPCFHAFCYDCINNSLNADRNLARKKKSSKSPEITYSDKCPTCKIKISKRSITVSEHLEDVAKSFKMVLPTFGMAPIKYDPQVEMTQYVPSDNSMASDDDMGDGDYDGSNGWGASVTGRRKSPATANLDDVAVNNQVARAMLQAWDDYEVDEDDDAPRGRATRSASAASGAATSASERFAKHQREMRKRADKERANDLQRVVGGNEKHEKELIEAMRKQQDANAERMRSANATSADAVDAPTPEMSGVVGEDGTLDTGSSTTAGIAGAAANDPMNMDDEEREKEGQETERPLSDEEKAVAAAEEAGQNYLDSAKKATPKRQDIPWFRDSSVPNVDETEGVPNVAIPAGESGNKKDISDITTDSTILREVAAAATAGNDNDNAQPPSSPVHDKTPSRSQDSEPPFEYQAADEDGGMSDYGHDEDEEMPDSCGGATLTQDVREKEVADRSGEDRDSQSERLQDLLDQMKEEGADRVEPGASQIELSHDGDYDDAPSEQDDEEMEKLDPVCESENEQSGEEEDAKEPEQPAAEAEEPADMDVADETDEATAGDAAMVPPPTPQQEEDAEKDTAVEHGATQEKQAGTLSTGNTADLLSVGTIVSVQSRTWAGINKPGGVARITKVHSEGAKYNVRYVLGGQEKDVDAIYVQAHAEGQDEFASPAKSRRGAATASAEGGTGSGPARRVGRSRRAAAASKQAKENRTPSTSAYMPDNLTEDAALKKAMADSLQMENKTRSRTAHLSQDSDEIDAAATSASSAKQNQKKGGTKRSKTTSKSDGARKPAAKKQKKAAVAAADSSTLDSIPENMDVADAERVVISASTKLHLADVRYKELLENKRTINVVTSSLSGADKDALDEVTLQLKKAGVTMKQGKEFKPHVTDLCITVRDETSDAPENYVVSKVRTLKAMRSALAGIPIVTPDWLRSCLDEKAFVVPADNNCIRTLPPKLDSSHLLPKPFVESTHSGPTAWLGVANYAALLQRQSEGGGEQYEHRPLVNTYVLLCGQFKKGTGVPPKADLVTLLGDAGANIVSSVAAMNKELKKTDEDSTLVVLCDDAKSDKQSGITIPLSKAMTAVLEDEDRNRRIMVVTYTWLFDSVSCGELLDADNYKPHSPKAKTLWELSTA